MIAQREECFLMNKTNTKLQAIFITLIRFRLRFDFFILILRKLIKRESQCKGNHNNE